MVLRPLGVLWHDVGRMKRKHFCHLGWDLHSSLSTRETTKKHIGGHAKHSRKRATLDIESKRKASSAPWQSSDACLRDSETRRDSLKDFDTVLDPTTTGHTSPLDRVSPTLTILAGTDVGRTFTLDAETITIGRSPESDIHIAHESISRKHCQLIVRAPSQVHVRDLGSTNGTYVNDTDLADATRELLGGERIRLSKKVILKFAFQDRLERGVQEDLYSSAVRDSLTGIYNKRFLQERLTHEVTYATRHGSNLCLLMFDLDHFKQINDAYGHTVGDQVLVEVVRRVHNTLRSEDVFARYGGEEFVVIMRGITLKEAEKASKRILSAVGSRPIGTDKEDVHVGVSIGVANFSSANEPTATELLTQADALLYQAKEQGRNCVVCSSPELPT